MIRFTQITEHVAYLPRLKADLSIAHAAVVEYAIKNFQNTQRFKNSVIRVINTLTYYLYVDGRLPDSWNPSDPLSVTLVPDDDCKSGSGNMYVYLKEIEWDIKESDAASIPAPVFAIKTPEPASTVVAASQVPTKKSDLYLQPPMYPKFDTSKIWASGYVGGERFCIYESLPEIPTRQNEISVTTEVSRMAVADLMRLYPTEFIPTRHASMYEDVPGLIRHPVLGIILPIEGYTQKQLVNNLVSYPHLFKLLKDVGDGNLESFYSTVEIDGELHKTLDVWDSLPEARMIPKTAECIKEYVVRRYLLERDVKKIDHRYKLYGTLDPFITLFAPAQTYLELGYKDVEGIARQCVESRVSYKRSRNPILGRLKDV